MFLQAASEEESDRMKIMIREAAALLAAEQLHALVYLAPVRVLAPALEGAEEELDVPRNGCISAISAMILRYSFMLDVMEEEEEEIGDGK